MSLEFDEEEIYQSKRLDLYKNHISILKGKGLTYKDEGAWRFKVKAGKTLSWKDAVHGNVEFKSDVLEDFVILKSDGFPTYHFANVIDDHETKITHVFRGDEWISSTPKHLLLYESFGWQPPTYVHLPVILGPDHKKLSKRQGAKSTVEFIDEGYLPEAIINFLAFLGWTPKSNQEIFSLEELTKEFSLERINKNSPIFNIEKLKWFNNQWIKNLPDDDLASRIAKEFPHYDAIKIKEVIPIIKTRIFTLKDFGNIAGFFFEKPKLDPVISHIPISGVSLASVAQNYQSVDWNSQAIRAGTVSIAEQENIAPKDLFRGIGIAVSGSTVTPPLFESMEKLGQAETIARITDAAKKKK